jgi:two-component system phosphate regulon sensor histidine kinase PhoR
MNKRIFIFIIILMTVSLVGIIFVQGYWIKNTVESNEEQFSMGAKQILINVVQQLEKDEVDKYYFKFASIADSTIPVRAQLSEIFQLPDEGISTEYFTYSNRLFQEDYKIDSPFLAENQDSIEFKKLISRKVTAVMRREGMDGNTINALERYERINNLEDEQKYLWLDAIMEMASKIPIHERVDTLEIKKLIDEQMEKRNLKSDFDFGIYSNALSTKVKTASFELNSPSTYGVPVYSYNDEYSDYQLFINFKDKNKQILSSIALMGGLSVLFTLVIVLAFSSAIGQLIRQRQISQIKTDFINNMTHEFKTPIATINLALDSVKNPIISNNPEAVDRYMNMIREENKRMHAQVENVLRISKLEKNELNIDKEKFNLHDIIEDSISHINLIVEDRDGYIKTHLDAKRDSILANNSHFSNVIINILDNSVKYSTSEPKITVTTENVNNYIVLIISDQGNGMAKQVQKKIFDKFYREHTGDVHNVKGHGLGLAYAKQIVDDHHGEISVKSEKGKGSSFIIKLPLIS